MCGIVGYVGANPCASYILDGLKRLEYRGYDSAGIAVLQGGDISIERSVGKLAKLEEQLRGVDLTGTVGIGHTRWATHGAPSEENAHPHFMEDVVVVHNGIIENYMKLREELVAAGYRFTSETDTEVVPHLIHQYLSEGCVLETAFRKSLDHLEGSYALAVICSREPRRIYAARRASPLVVGLGEGENFVASDVPALLAHTRKFIFLEDGDLAILDEDRVKIIDGKGQTAERPLTQVDWTPAMAEKGGYKHFMLKEIYEQPRALADTLSGRLHPVEGEVALEGGEAAERIAREIDALHIVACGTSYHAALVGKYWIERLARMPVVVDLASEYRYRDPLLDEKTGLLLVSQSGETADTLAALVLGLEKSAPVLGICNVVGSSLARAADATLYTHAGPEIGVASTKAFTTQLVTLYLMALFLAKSRGTLVGEALTSRMTALRKTPRMVKKVLELDDACRTMAKAMLEARSALYLGRGRNYPIALEGALKLKEISYIHAEGYAAGEMKHGPIALVDDGLPVVSIMTKGINYEKMVSNVEEIRARSGRIFTLATEGDELAEQLSEQVLWMPDFFEELMPVVNAVPLQLLAYHVAQLKGTDVDQPRNLAKSVTVE